MNELKTAALLTGVAWCLAWSNCSAVGAEQVTSALPAQTQWILSGIEQRATKRTGADKRAAESLNRDGERAYRKGSYHAAWSAFSNSYPNFPTVFAYIMTGDTHWREVVRIAKMRSAASHAGPADDCAMSNEYFPHDLQMDIDQHHEVGLALAAKANGGTLPSDPFLQRAQESARCLRDLGTRYKAQPSTACVDLDALAACLGAPLPLPSSTP